MSLFTKQRDKFRCGPVAILNALRWAGVDIPYDEIHFIGELCIVTSPDGSTHGSFDKALRKMGDNHFTVRKVMKPSLFEIEEHLRLGGALVLNYRWRRDWIMDPKKRTSRHYSLIIGISDSGRTFYVVNGRRKRKALKGIRREDFKKWELRFPKDDLKAWFLTPLQNVC